MAVFLNLRRWWESAELNQAEAAELLRVSERRFRSWMRRYEEEGEGPASSTAGSARRRASWSRATEPRRVERLYRERDQGFTVKPFPEHLSKARGFGWGYTWLKLHLQMGRAPCRRRRAKGRAGGSASGARSLA